MLEWFDFLISDVFGSFFATFKIWVTLRISWIFKHVQSPSVCMCVCVICDLPGGWVTYWFQGAQNSSLIMIIVQFFFWKFQYVTLQYVTYPVRGYTLDFSLRSHIGFFILVTLLFETNIWPTLGHISGNLKAFMNCECLHGPHAFYA